LPGFGKCGAFLCCAAGATESTHEVLHPEGLPTAPGSDVSGHLLTIRSADGPHLPGLANLCAEVATELMHEELHNRASSRPAPGTCFPSCGKLALYHLPRILFKPKQKKRFGSS
jgi:hypothetical protein